MPGLWKAAFAVHQFEVLPILADALEETGCASAGLLEWFRDPNAVSGPLGPRMTLLTDTIRSSGVLEGFAARPAAELLREVFVAKYSVRVVSDHEVSFSIPKGLSYIDLLRDSQALAPALYRHESILGPFLADCEAHQAFTTPVTTPMWREVDGKVPHSNNMRRDEQEARGWNDVELRDLAAAHQAYFIATGNDLFGGHAVRARGDTIRFLSSGLYSPSSVGGIPFNDDFRYDFVSASRLCPVRLRVSS